MIDNNSKTKEKDKWSSAFSIYPSDSGIVFGAGHLICTSVSLSYSECLNAACQTRVEMAPAPLSPVYQKRSVLIKIALAAVEKMPVSAPWDASVYVKHFPSWSWLQRAAGMCFVYWPHIPL